LPTPEGPEMTTSSPRLGLIAAIPRTLRSRPADGPRTSCRPGYADGEGEGATRGASDGRGRQASGSRTRRRLRWDGPARPGAPGSDGSGRCRGHSGGVYAHLLFVPPRTG